MVIVIFKDGTLRGFDADTFIWSHGLREVEIFRFNGVRADGTKARSKVSEFRYDDDNPVQEITTDTTGYAITKRDGKTGRFVQA